MARHNLWPIPTVKGNYNKAGLSARSGDGLATAVNKAETFPTPCARDHKDSGPNVNYEKIRKKGKLEGSAGGPLNPDWVEWLMGWPIGLTASGPAEMESFLLWLRLHGVNSLSDF